MYAFWNKHHQGCDEHLLVHKLRSSGVYLPELSRVAAVGGGLSGFGGSFCEPEVFEDLPKEENEQFTKSFSAPPKQKFPSQWD